MTVELLHATPLWINAYGARTCWDSGDKSDSVREYDCIDGEYIGTTLGKKDAELIDRVGNKYRHASILEHVSYNFSIEGVSRALLQELARHRMASLSVKSTRYTLKELKEEQIRLESDPMDCVNGWDYTTIKKYCVLPDYDHDTIIHLGSALWSIQKKLLAGKSNDRVKYLLPEAYKTSLTWSINMRSLQNFLSLRSDKSALWEIQKLAHAIYNELPLEHRYLFEASIKEILPS
jgi:thymidylate synthase (FAD)